MTGWEDWDVSRYKQTAKKTAAVVYSKTPARINTEYASDIVARYKSQNQGLNKAMDLKDKLLSDMGFAKDRLSQLAFLMAHSTGDTYLAYKKESNALQLKLKEYSDKLVVVNQQIANFNKTSDNNENQRFVANRRPANTSKTTKIKDKQKPPPPPPADNALQYNVGAVSEAYFTSRSEFLLDGKNTETLHSAVSGDKPSPALSSALELWNNGKASKGMFITWGDLNTGFQAANADQGLEQLMHETLPPQAFRFQYNPGSISMAYAGTPLVDPNFEASGLDKFNLVGTGVTQSTIQFQLLINRMYDMKYYVREDEIISDANGENYEPGILKPEAQNVYGEQKLTLATQKAVYNLGTMYDFEFLLRTIMGYSMKSSLRDYSFFKDGGTADMGFLGARPVELHLGKNLRYLVFITGINVEHVIFDNRMVPLFSNVSITCSRLPDYQSSGKSQSSSTDTHPVGDTANRSALLRKLR
jgi:hypothetical protein